MALKHLIGAIFYHFKENGKYGCLLGPQDAPKGLLEVEISTIYIDFWFPKHPTNLRFAFAEGVAQDPWHKSCWFRICGFPKLLLGVSFIWVCILRIYILCYTLVLSNKQTKLEDNITGQNRNGNKVMKPQKTTSQFMF